MSSRTRIFCLTSQKALGAVGISSRIDRTTIIIARNFSLQAFYRKVVVPIPKEGIHPIILPNNFIGRYRNRKVKKLFEKHEELDADIKNGEKPLPLFMNFDSPWKGQNIVFRDRVLFSPIDRTGMKLWSYMHVPWYKKRWLRVTGTIFLAVGLGMPFFWFFNRQKNPITGRAQFIMGSHENFIRIADADYQKKLQEGRGHLLPSDHPTTKAIKETFDHLFAFSGLEGGPEEWEVFVLNAPSILNASVYYNKKVLVYSGILDVAEDSNGIAVILSHEIAHIVAKHNAELISNLRFWVVFGIPFIPILLCPLFDPELVVLASIRVFPWVARIFSWFRTMETEADYIGLTIMAAAGYDIRDAQKLWERQMEASEKNKQRQIEEQARQGKVYKECSEILRSHPTDEKRLQKIKEMIPEIIEKNGWK